MQKCNINQAKKLMKMKNNDKNKTNKSKNLRIKWTQGNEKLTSLGITQPLGDL